jgi:hypothetical protein
VRILLRAGPPRSGLGHGDKCFELPSKDGPAKNLYTKSERLTLSWRVNLGLV